MKHEELIEIESQIDLKVFSDIPVTDQLRFGEYIKLIAKANDVFVSGGIAGLRESAYYNRDRTFNLMFFWLFEAGISKEVYYQLLRNYKHCLEDSDVYSAKLLLLGVGAMLIKIGIDTSSMVLYLSSLFGTEFAKKNYKRILETRDNIKLDEASEIIIKYKEYNLTYRDKKYDLLALLKISKDYDGETLRKLVYDIYADPELSTMFHLLDVSDKEISRTVFAKLIKGAPKNERFYLTAAMCLVERAPIVNMHYLLNSELGKLTNFGKPYSEVMAEIKNHEDKILAASN